MIPIPEKSLLREMRENARSSALTPVDCWMPHGFEMLDTFVCMAQHTKRPIAAGELQRHGLFESACTCAYEVNQQLDPARLSSREQAAWNAVLEGLSVLQLTRQTHADVTVLTAIICDLWLIALRDACPACPLQQPVAQVAALATDETFHEQVSASLRDNSTNVDHLVAEMLARLEPLRTSMIPPHRWRSLTPPWNRRPARPWLRVAPAIAAGVAAAAFVVAWPGTNEAPAIVIATITTLVCSCAVALAFRGAWTMRWGAILPMVIMFLGGVAIGNWQRLDPAYAFERALGTPPPSSMRNLHAAGSFVGRQSDTTYEVWFDADEALVNRILSTRHFIRDADAERNTGVVAGEHDCWMPFQRPPRGPRWTPKSPRLYRWQDGDGAESSILLFDPDLGRAIVSYRYG